jgi:hypothetical protein
LSLGLVAVLAGCYGPDEEALGAAAGISVAAEPGPRGDELLARLTEPGVGVVSEACATKLHDGLTAPDARAREKALTGALSGPCHGACGYDELTRLEPQDRASRQAEVLRICDASGPDPVFGRAELAVLRAELDPVEYLVARTVLAPTLAATAGTDLGTRYERLVLDVAASLAGRPPPIPAWKTTRVDVTSNLDGHGVVRAAEAALSSCGAGEARLVLDASGHVVVATPGDTAGSDCVASALAAATWPASTDHGYARVDVAWSGSPALSTYDALGIAPPHASVLPGDTVATGALAQEVVREALLKTAGQLKYCYEHALRKDPTAKGDVELTFGIAADGSVSDPKATLSELDAEATACMVKKASRWTFGEAEGGALTTVVQRYAFAWGP